MAEHPYMPFFPEKFFADTLHLHWDARAVYLELLAIAWNRGGALPNDQNQLRLMVGCYSKAWGRIWSEIAPFWTLGEDGQLHQKRLDLEWKRVVARRPRLAAQKASNRRILKNPDGKKPNDFSCAPARESHTHIHIEEAKPSSRALTRDPPISKNGRDETRDRYGQNRKPSLAELARRKIQEREERESSGEGGVYDLQLIPKIRH